MSHFVSEYQGGYFRLPWVRETVWHHTDGDGDHDSCVKQRQRRQRKSFKTTAEYEGNETVPVSQRDRRKCVCEWSPDGDQGECPKKEKYAFDEAGIVVDRADSEKENPGVAGYGKCDYPFDGDGEGPWDTGIYRDDFADC